MQKTDGETPPDGGPFFAKEKWLLKILVSGMVNERKFAFDRR